MYRFTINTDVEMIKSTVLNSNNRRFQFDDSHNPDDFEPYLLHPVYHIAVYDNDVFQGFFFLIDKGSGVAEAHLAFLPKAYGKVSDMGRQCLQWVWSNFNFHTLVAPCIEDNKLALKCITDIGFKPYELVENSWIKDGKSYNYIWLRITKQNDHNISEV